MAISTFLTACHPLAHVSSQAAYGDPSIHPVSRLRRSSAHSETDNGPGPTVGLATARMCNTVRSSHVQAESHDQFEGGSVGSSHLHQALRYSITDGQMQELEPCKPVKLVTCVLQSSFVPGKARRPSSKSILISCPCKPASIGAKVDAGASSFASLGRLKSLGTRRPSFAQADTLSLSGLPLHE